MFTINLPAETIKSIVNINSANLTMSIENAFDEMSVENAEPIKSMWANPTIFRSTY